MSLIYLVLMLAIIGFLLWLVTTYVPMPEVFKRVILVIVVLALVLWLLQLFGIVGPMIGRVH